MITHLYQVIILIFAIYCTSKENFQDYDMDEMTQEKSN